MNRRNLNWILGLVILLFSNAMHAQPGKDYQSLMWEISNPQSKGKVSYLYGTMHVSRKLAFNLSDSFFIALNSADMIALESDPTTWLKEIMNLKYATDYFGNYPANTYAAKGFYQRAFDLKIPENELIGDMISSRDNMINSLQFRNNPYMTDFEEDTYLDMFIYMAGAKTKRPVLGLEDMEYTSDLRRMAYSERRDRKNEKVIPVWLEDMLKQKDLGTLFEDAYRKQDLDLMHELSSFYQSDFFRKWFIDERNRKMVDSLEVLMKDNSVFTGVGAAHLPGQFGMIQMLRERGYDVRPVNFTKTEFATQQKNMYDSLRTNLKFSMVKSPDNQFSLLLPAPLYEIPYNGKSYLCSEMTNGSFVSINKMNTFAFMKNMSTVEILKKVDSVLFENIPGTILSKKNIQNGEYKGIEIKNKTKTGDYQHFQIFATPFEILIFKVGGKGDFANKWSDTVFNSLVFHEKFDKKAPWKEVNHVYGGFSVQLPSVMVLDNVSPIAAAYNSPTYQAIDPKTDAFFYLNKSSLMDVSYLEEDAFELQRFAKKIAKKHNMDLGKSTLVQTSQKLPAIDFIMTNKEGQKLDARIIIQGGNYYLMLVQSKKDKQAANKFFNSFKVVETKNFAPYETYTDTVLFFSTLTSKQVAESETRIPYKYDKPKEHESYSESSLFKSESGERIRVSFYKFNYYKHYDNIDSLWEETIREQTEDNSLVLKSKKAYMKNGHYVMDLMLTDTATVRAVKLMLMLKKEGDAMYFVKSLVDTIFPTSPYLNAFYENFAPKDTLFGSSIFDNKGKLFLNDLFGSDSSANKRAMEALANIKLDSSHALQAIEIIENFDKLNNNKPYLKAHIVKLLQKVKHPDLTTFAKNMYFINPNNYPVQLGAIGIICAQQNKEAVDALKEIMDKDLPFIMENDRFVLSPLRMDSMGLWKNLYPKMFEFDHVEEYKSMIFYDLSRMLDSSVIDADFYAGFLNKLKDEAGTVLKRQLAIEQKKQLEEDKKEALEEKKSSSPAMYPNWTLVQKYKLLLPHASDPLVGKIIKEYEANIRSDIDKIYMVKYRIENKLPVEKNEIVEVAKNVNYTLKLYEMLEPLDANAQIPAELLATENLAKLSLNNSGGGYSYYGSSYDFEKDTFKLIKKGQESIKGRDYQYFIYQVNGFISKSAADKYNFSPKDYKKLAFIAVETKDGIFVNKGINIKSSIRFENPDKLDKYLEELIEEFEVKERKRASAKEINDSYYDEEYW